MSFFELPPPSRLALLTAIGAAAIAAAWAWQARRRFRTRRLTAEERATIGHHLRTLEAVSPDARFAAAVRRGGRHVVGVLEEGAAPDGERGTSVTVRAGRGMRPQIYLAGDFFDRTDRLSQLRTLVKECVLRAGYGDFDDTGASDNRLDALFEPLINQLFAEITVADVEDDLRPSGPRAARGIP